MPTSRSSRTTEQNCFRSLPLGGTTYPFAVSSKGDLFANVSNGGHRPYSLNVYAKQGNKLVQTINENQRFSLMTVDLAGNLFVACAAQRVCEYAFSPKTGIRKSVARTIQFTNDVGVGALATDHSGDLAIANAAGIFVYPPKAKTPSWSIPNPKLITRSMVFDSAGNLYVATGVSSAQVEIFAPGSSTPSRTIVDGNGPSANQVAIDGSDNLYVLTGNCLRSCTTQPAVAVYPFGESNPSYTVTDGLTIGVTHDMSVSSDGELYVCNEGVSVIAYASGATHRQREISDHKNTPYQVGVAE
jgi:ligand-binding sensor domain-containing protein